MRILLITDEVWNDSINGNNVLTNWFEGFDAEFANIYCCPGLPENKCCDKYFQVTDKEMIKSILKGTKAGRILKDNERYVPTNEKYNSTDVNGISFMRKYFGNLLRLFKSVVWNMGKYDTDNLDRFIKEFNPDVVFSPRFANSKIIRLEKEALKHTSAPLVAFTGDNEYSLRKLDFSPVAWINTFYQRSVLKRMMPNYKLYYTLSAEQKTEYEKAFPGINIKMLMKCADFSGEYLPKKIGNPIRIVYAGKLYANRWKTLAAIGDALKEINKDSVRMILDIYTRDKVTVKQKSRIDDGRSIFLKGGVAPEELPEIYKAADIALHAESFDLKYRYATRVSFSTKIIDCLASSCAVMAIAWREHSGLTYLKREDAGICINSLGDIKAVLTDLCDNPTKITEYQEKAWMCGQKNHNRKVVQKDLYEDFEMVQNEH